MPGFRWRKEGPLPQVLAPVRRLQQPLGRVGGHLPGRRHTMGCLKGVQGLGPMALAAKIDSALGRAHATLPGFRWTRGTHPATCPSKTFTDPSDWLVVSTWRVPAPKDSLHRSSLAMAWSQGPVGRLQGLCDRLSAATVQLDHLPDRDPTATFTQTESRLSSPCLPIYIFHGV